MNKKILSLLLALTLTCPLFAAEIPAEEDLEKLVLDTLVSFNDSVQSDDFTDFHATMAKPAQEQISVEKLKTSFHEFVEKKIDFSDIENLDPTFDSKEIDKDGILNVAGSYPTTPVIVQFRLRYLQEEGEWKLFGINVDTKKESPATLDAQKKETP
jgi:hypothetical protein